MADDNKKLKAILDNIGDMLEEKFGDSAEDLELIVEGLGDDDDEVTIYDENGHAIIPAIALRGFNILPGSVVHFDVGREKSIKALEKVMAKNQYIFVVSQKDDSVDSPTREDLYDIGTLIKVKQMLKVPGNIVRVLVEGLDRAEIIATIQEDPYFAFEINRLPEAETEETNEREATRRVALDLFEDYLNYVGKDTLERLREAAAIKPLGKFADFIAWHMDMGYAEQQKILEKVNPDERMRDVLDSLDKEVQILRLEDEISATVRKNINQNQQEYYLREQAKAINEKLGDKEDMDSEIEKWRDQIKKKKLPKEVAEKVEKEIHKLSKMPTTTAEGNVSRTYIESILELPWNKLSKSKYDLNKARTVLDKDHYGLEDVKERILEYLAVVQLSGEVKGPILCLVGPPGVGKTSVVKSVASAIDRKYVRMSLGGVRDEAEIRGHRRTYISAYPGRIINGIKDAGTGNPVFLLDEIDKVGSDYKGDPAAALLEVLDPEQNKAFVDHFLEVPYDLSKVIFITTANDISTIPRPLLDRMELIEVSGYTEEDKVKIAKNYLIPKQIKENGLKSGEISIKEDAIRDLINYYTRESGVRGLEREIANLCRKVALKIVTKKAKSYGINGKSLEKYLGKHKFRYDHIQNQFEMGVTTGMAWTSVGGDTLFIESAIMRGSGNLVLTGQLGDVMQESAKAAISYIRSISESLAIRESYREFYKENDFHIHVPEGATPKDGPSAGVTICMSIISTLTGEKARKDVAMTGEITLLGKILAVGGIKEKVLAAYRAGVRKILLPRENERDIEEIPANVRKQIEFILLDTAADAIPHVFEDGAKVFVKEK